MWGFCQIEALHQLYSRDVSYRPTDKRNYKQTHVGYAERNSARLAERHKLQTPAIINPHNTADGPPEGSARDREAESAVQELRIAKASPNIDL